MEASTNGKASMQAEAAGDSGEASDSGASATPAKMAHKKGHYPAYKRTTNLKKLVSRIK